MSHVIDDSAFDRATEPLFRLLTGEQLEQLTSLARDQHLEGRVAELAEKAQAGELSESELRRVRGIRPREQSHLGRSGNCSSSADGQTAVTTTAIRKQVVARADSRCEYCLRHQDDSPLLPLHVEHVVPRKHGGSDSIDNLALACADCNLRKGPNLTGIDPDTTAVTRLFNPRLDSWKNHFRWTGVDLVGLTAVGRTTIRVSALNADDRLEVRLYATRPAQREV